jgi:hypothetical protein
VSPPAGLHSLCARLVDELAADACVVSRALGDVLIQVAEHVRDGGTLLLGQGHLASDYPLTVEVLERHRPRTVSTSDPDADSAEVGLLRVLGYDALLMLPLLADGERWGLVEVYARGRAFGEADAAAAERLVAARSGAVAA